MLSGSLGKHQSRKRYLLRYAMVPCVIYLAKRTTQGSDQLRGFCDRFFYRPYSAALSFPPRGVTETSGYRFEYDLHLIKIPSNLDGERIHYLW